MPVRAVGSSSVGGVAKVSFTPERLKQIAELKQLVMAGIGKAEPHVGGTPAGSVFHTNYDYHSSVHAHWAALSMARTTHDPKLEKQVMARLTPAALEKERKFFQANPTFELPYGQAWMLVMAKELTQHPAGNTEATRKLKAETEARVVDWLEKSPFPEGPNGQLNAAHDSWLFAYSLLKQSGPSGALKDRLAALEKRIDAARPAIAKSVSTPEDFLDLGAVLATIDRTPPKKAGVGPYTGKVGALPQGPIDFSNVHSAGTAAMRVWPYAMDAAANRPGAAKQVDQRIAEMMKRPELYKSDFETASHWVPQFMWMAMLREAGG